MKSMEGQETQKFVPVSCVFDPLYDLEEVDQFGFVDLRHALAEGVLPGDLQVDESQFNGIDDPESIIGVASDQFDAIRKGAYVKSAESAAKANAEAASSAVSE